MLSIGLLAHFDVSDGIAALLNVGDLRGGVLGRAVEHGDGNHCRQVVGESAGKENIEAAVLVVSTVVHVSGGMPGIDGGTGIRSPLFVRTLRRLDESPGRIGRARRDLL